MLTSGVLQIEMVNRMVRSSVMPWMGMIQIKRICDQS